MTLGLPAAGNDDAVDLQDPSVDDIIGVFQHQRQGKRPSTRGVVPSSVTAGAGAVAMPAPDEPKRASFGQITFELNSDRISTAARPILDKLGRALESYELMDMNFVVEGHTDASGTVSYNMRLSKRRAESVKRYLVENFEIDASRLKTLGKGPTELRDKDNPLSGVNRRVVVALGQ
jgi:outer membrane protein OmpA-like peptidoglycan-associated protein